MLIIGDTHGSIDTEKISIMEFFYEDKLKDLANGKVLIAGDFGGVWYKSKPGTIHPKDINAMEDIYGSNPFDILFIRGNHENHDLLETLPTTEGFGGIVRPIIDKVTQLCDSYVFEIDGIKILVMGGADSVDKAYRTKHLTWWPQELISEEEYKKACEELDKVNWEVDIVLTHTCPLSVIPLLEQHLPVWDETYFGKKSIDPSTTYLQKIADKIKTKYWCFGHFHVDVTLPMENITYIALYNEAAAFNIKDGKLVYEHVQLGIGNRFYTKYVKGE